MKKLTVAILASLILFGLAFAAPKEATFTGLVSDRYCVKANSHELMMKRHGSKNIEDCIRDCVKAGGKYVLVDADNKMYELDDQQKPAPFALQKVKITGTLDKTTQIIHVTNIVRLP